jgi:putative SOS response-associated peptidase YedK
MCGRYTLTAEPAAIQQAFDLTTLPSELAPRYNIAPTQPVPIITSDNPHALTIVQWGLVPSWSKDPSVASKLINARAETLDEKPSFKQAFKRRRCLIPADGFFEWRSDNGKKRPQFIYVGEREVFAFAGLWDTWHSPDGSVLQSCTIITTEPNDLIRTLHHRMAVILNQADYRTWLAPDAEGVALKALLQPYPAERLQLYEVAPLVNNANIDTPDIIIPHTPPAPPQQKTLF